MNNRLLSEFLSMNSSTDQILANFIIKRDFWGNFLFSRFTEKDEGIEAKISPQEINENLAIIATRSAKFIYLKIINVLYLLLATVGFLGIPTFCLLAYLNYNVKMSPNSFVLLVVTLVATVVIFLGFVVALRRQILKFYTKKIQKILNELNNQKYIARNLFWEVSEQCMSLKLHELSQNPSEKNDYSTF